MVEHTPGPWFCAPSGGRMLGYSQSWGVASDNANLIAGVFNDGEGGEDAAAANAAYIVRACNSYGPLLEALEGLLEGFPDEGEYELVQGGFTPNEARKVAVARAAISLAHGEEDYHG